MLTAWKTNGLKAKTPNRDRKGVRTGSSDWDRKGGRTVLTPFSWTVHPLRHFGDDAIDAELGANFVEPAFAISAVAFWVEMEFHFDRAVALLGDAERLEEVLGEVAQPAVGGWRRRLSR